jgi:hypothetical protein
MRATCAIARSDNRTTCENENGKACCTESDDCSTADSNTLTNRKDERHSTLEEIGFELNLHHATLQPKTDC